MGTQWKCKYSLWEPWGLAGISLRCKSHMIMRLNGTCVCASEVRWEGGTKSCLDKADELRNSVCLLRYSEIPNPRSVSHSDGCKCSAQDQERSWLLLLRDEDRLSRVNAFSKAILITPF